MNHRLFDGISQPTIVPDSGSWSLKGLQWSRSMHRRMCDGSSHLTVAVQIFFFLLISLLYFDNCCMLGTMAPKRPQGRGKGQQSGQTSNPPARITRQSRHPRVSSSSSSEEVIESSHNITPIPDPVKAGVEASSPVQEDVP